MAAREAKADCWTGLIRGTDVAAACAVEGDRKGIS